MRHRAARTVPVPRDAVYAWWTDFQRDDHGGPGSPARSVREVLRREGRELWIRDRATRPIRITIEEHVVLDPPRGYRVEARYPLADVDYAYAFDPVPGGTRVTMAADVRPRGLGRVLVPLASPWWRRYADRDLEFHLREMAADLAP